MKDIDLKATGSSTLAGYVETVDVFSSPFRHGWIFRGQGDFEQPLRPKVGRDEFHDLFYEKMKETSTPLGDRDLEIFERWRSDAVAVADVPENDFEALAYAQHFGLATRLLDWTKNPLVALYFAVEGKYDWEKDGVVYIHKPGVLIDTNKDRFADIEYDRLLEVRPFDARIAAQSGCFTFHKEPHKDYAPVPLFIRTRPEKKRRRNIQIRVHSELGMSPWEAWHERLDCISGLIFDVKSVSDALRYPEEVTVDRGAIRVDRTTYKAAELGALNDKSVIVLTDPETPRKKVDVFYKNKFLCQATREDGDLADDLNVERTDRIIRLKKVKRDAKKAFEDTPPLESWPVKKPRKAGKPKAIKPKPSVPTPTLGTEEE